jgi:hypothetical protein
MDLFKEKFSMTVHSLEGYNFSLEYAHVYRAKSDSSFFPLDVFSVCQRSLIAFDPFLAADTLQLYAEFIVRVGYWEAMKAPTSGDRALTAAFPDANAGVDDSESATAARSVRAYIGLDALDMSLCCFIRVASGVKSFTADDAVRVTESKAAKNLELISYQKYALNLESIERWDELMSFSDSQEGSGEGNKVSQEINRSVRDSQIYLKVLLDAESTAEYLEISQEGQDVEIQGGGEDEHVDVLEGSRTRGDTHKKDVVHLISKHRNQEAYRDPSPTSELMVIHRSSNIY